MSELKAVNLRRKNRDTKKKEKGGKKKGERVYLGHKNKSKTPNSEVPGIEVIYGSLSSARALPLLSKSPAPITLEHLRHYYINKVLNFKYLVRSKRSHNKLLNMIPLV